MPSPDTPRSLTLLITGGAGYIGSVVAERALAYGHRVVVIDSLQAGCRDLVPADATFLEGDIGDGPLLDAVFAAHRMHAVCHLAAEADVAQSMTNPAAFFDTNVAKGFVLLERMRQHGVATLLFSSTAATYGEPVSVPITEEHPQRPINAYGASKLMFEEMIRWYHAAYGMRAVVFRYFNAAGATAARGESRRHEAHLLPLAIDAAFGRREAIVVHGDDYPTRDGTCIRDFVHVVDIADAHLAGLVRAEHVGYGVFNLGTGTGYSVREVLAAVERVTGRPVPATVGARRDGDPAVLVAGASHAQRVLDWAPVHSSLDHIIATACAWRAQTASISASDATTSASQDDVRR